MININAVRDELRQLVAEAQAYGMSKALVERLSDARAALSALEAAREKRS